MIDCVDDSDPTFFPLLHLITTETLIAHHVVILQKFYDLKSELHSGL